MLDEGKFSNASLVHVSVNSFSACFPQVKVKFTIQQLIVVKFV